ncbi:MAG: DUF4012 domain-containing protein, partial [Acidimicrobiales bacterium]|nr:DUF4012 domain-containing protein [Acidimicrobiales bacterium]
GFAAALLLARADLVRGVDRAEAGLDAAREGRGGQSADLLAGAARDLSDAHRRLDAWWARPVLGLPLVGQQARALSTLSEEGARLAASGAAGVRAAGLDDLRVVDGQVDLAQVRSMAEPLRSVRAQLADSLDGLEGAGSPWLLPPLAGGLDRFERTVVAAAGDADTAAQAVAVLPKLLGGDGERRYLIAFGTPAEARELGGFMGAYAVLAARDGDLSLGGSNRVRNLNVFFQGSRFSDPGALPSSYLAMLPQRFWHNMTATPSFPTMAEAVGQLWQPPRAGELDGILYMDPHTLAALLKLTGPIRIEGHQEPLTSRNAAQFLLRDQYTEFPDDDRHEFLVDAAEQVFDELTTGTLPEPNEVADALSPVIAGRRLLAHSYHPAEQALFEQLGIDGGLPDGQGDFLTVRTQNRGLNKIDALLERSIHYEVARDPSGAGITARVTITLRNEAPSSGLPHSVIGNRLGQPDGTNSTTLAIYTPLELVDVTDDGRSIGRAASPEYGRNRFAVLLDLPPHSERTIVFELAGPLDLAHGYHLDLVPQPLATADRMTVTVRLPLFGVVTPIADRPHNRTFTVDLRSLR